MRQRYESETNSAIGRTSNRFVIQILSFVSGDISLTECRAYWRVRPSGKMKHLFLMISAALSLSFIAAAIGQTEKEKEETAEKKEQGSAKSMPNPPPGAAPGKYENEMDEVKERMKEARERRAKMGNQPVQSPTPSSSVTAVFGASPSPSASVSATVVASPSASISLTPTPSPR